jgi:serine/threonine-protein kinase
LKKVAVTGGPPETISPVIDNQVRGGDWGEDGRIVLSAGDKLAIVPAAGGTPTTLGKAPAGRRLWYPQFVSKGRAILYTSTFPRPDSGDIEVLDVASQTSRKLLPGVAARLLPTGHLVFVRGSSLWAVRFDEDSLQVQGTPVPVVEGVRVEAGGAIQFSVARDGTLIYLPGAGNAAMDLGWIDRQGHEEQFGLSRRVFFAARVDPTGQRLALEVRDGNSDIWVLTLGRQTPTRVTFDAGDDFHPAWTPHGRLVFVSNRDNGTALFVQPADGTGSAQKITAGPNLDQPDVTPDGRFVIARMSDDIVLVSLDGKGTVQKLIESPFRERNPTVSRDGRWIAYQSDESGVEAIYVRPFPDVGKGRWQVSEQGGGSRPVWGRNGKELFYLSADQTVMSVSFTATADAFSAMTPRKLMSLQQQVGGAARAYDVMADDNRFLTIKNDAATERAEIRIVLNWLEELKKKIPAN